MKKNIHPKYNKINAICSCGVNIEIFSTLNDNLNIDICSSCHPFYTGKKNIVDTDGRVGRFNRRFNYINLSNNSISNNEKNKIK